MELATKQNKPVAVPKKTNSFFPKKTEAPFFSSVFIQPKLSVGPADDAYEREADSVAERVMRMPDASSADMFFPATQPISKIQRQCASCEAEEKLQRMEEDEEDAIQTKREGQHDIQRQCAGCEQEDKMIQPKRLIQRMCSECEEEEQSVQTKRNGYAQANRSDLFVQRRCAACEHEEQAIQPKSNHSILRKADANLIQRRCAGCEEDETTISRKESVASATPQVSPSIHNVLNSPGQALDKSTRSFMESRFGYDFGHVRIHHDVFAQESSKDIHALAYTHGEHVVFGEGQYQPDTIEGKKLLAHELTHVVQQGKSARQAEIQRKPGELTSYNIPFGSMPLEKYSVEIENKYRQLYARHREQLYLKAANFIRKCRTEGVCDRILTIQEVDELFGIAKSNGFESSTSKVIGKIPGGLKIKLATLFIGQLIDFAAFQKTLTEAGFVILDDPLAICIEGCHHLNDVPKFPVIPDCEEPTPEELKRGSETEYELKGNTAFNPTGDLATYIIYNLKTKKNVTIKVRFGDLSRGVITLTKKFMGGFNDPFKSFNAGNSFSNMTEDGCVSPFDNEHEEATGMNILPLHHPAMNINSQKRMMALRVNIDEETITGEMGVLDEAITDFTNTVRNEFHFHTNRADFVPVVFGEDHAREEFEGLLYNKLQNGNLAFLMHGQLSVINQQKIDALFVASNEMHFWNGSIATEIAGTEPYSLPLSRTPEAYMSGDSYELDLSGEWKLKGFEAAGQIHITYSKGKISALGHGTIKEPGKNPRYTGEITISLSDYPTAERLFFKHIPGRAGPLDFENVKDTNLPDPSQKLALAAWGNFNFKINEGATTLSGDTAFVVHPSGAIITAGQIKVNTPYKIFNGFGNTAPLIPETILKIAEFDFTPIEIAISGHAELSASYHVGDVMFKELSISGVYSNFPGLLSEYELAAVFDVDANIRADLLAGITISANLDLYVTEYEMASVSFDIQGIGNLDIHVRARPSIKHTAPLPNQTPIYTLGGKLDLNGQMTIDLIAKVSAHLRLFEIHRDEEDKDKKSYENKNKRDFEKEAKIGHWTLGNFGFSKEISHTIGGKQDGPLLDPTPKKLTRALASAIWNRSATSKEVTKAGFEEGSVQKGEVADEPFEPIENAGEAIGKYSVEDSFTMNGAPHTLYMIVGGTKSNPEVDIEMHSDDHDKLLNKIDEEIAEEKITSSPLVLNQKETEINKEELHELNDLKTEATSLIRSTKAIATNGEAADRGIEHLADKTEDYGNKFEKTDLKDNTKDVAPVFYGPYENYDKPVHIPNIDTNDVIVDMKTNIGYVVTHVHLTIKIDERDVEGLKAEIEGGTRFFPYYNYGYYWEKRPKTKVEPFTVSPKKPRLPRIAHIRVGQENWDDGSEAREIPDAERKVIDYDPKGNKWNQAGHLVANSLGGPGNYRKANIVPMTKEANHSYTTGMRNIENAVWKDINTTYAIYDYNVEAIYDNSIQRPPVKIIVKVEKQFPDTKLPSNVKGETEVDNKA